MLFLNPIQFIAAAVAAGFSSADARTLYAKANNALSSTPARDLLAQGEPKALAPRNIPPAARGALRAALENQNQQRASAVEASVPGLPGVFVTLCAGVVADVRVVKDA